MLHAYSDRTTNEVHLALTRGEILPDKEVLVRVHEPLSVLDFLDPGNGRHTFSIGETQELLSRSDAGVIILLRRAETGLDILARLQEPASAKPPSAKWDPRIYGIGAQILRDLGVRRMKLLASPRKMPSMTGFDLEVTGFVASPVEPPCGATH